jgi:large subunit ribosomal protein L7/L12
MERWCPEVIAIGDRIAGLTLARSAELRRYLEEVHGLRPAQARQPEPVIVKPPVPPRVEFWDVRLDGFDPARKVAAIKEVRELTSLGLKEAKAVVEGPPRVLKEGLTEADAGKLRDRLAAAGLEASLVPSPAEVAAAG